MTKKKAKTIFAHGNYVVIRPDELRQSRGGILIPDNVKEKPKVGTVVSYGVSTPDSPLELHHGDRVWYAGWDAHEIEYDGEKLVACVASSILAYERDPDL